MMNQDKDSGRDASPGKYVRADRDRRDHRAYEAFLDQARRIADWQWKRSESFERKAGAVLAFVGIILTLQTAVVRSIIVVPKTVFAWAAFILLALSAVGLVVAALQSVKVLIPHTYRGPGIEQLRKQWERYNVDGHLSAEGVVGLFADQLLRESEEKAPVQSLYDDAKDRGEHFSSAIKALRASIIFIALVFVVAALQRATEEGNAIDRAGENRTTVTATTRVGPTSSTIPTGRESGRN
jgi:hypothetical protein